MTSVPPRTIRVRRIRFAHQDAPLRRHYVDDDLVMSHVVAVLSGVFPEGEDFFIRSVRAYRDSVTDPELAEQVRGFIGQEVTHSREHAALNERLRDMGYPTDRVDAYARRLLALVERVGGKRMSLAVTAALEHYTATLAECLLAEPRAQALLGDNEVRSILLWHALEESEHKSVAFDVYRTTGGGERLRIWTMRLTTAGFLLSIIGHSVLSLFGDRAAYHRVRLFRSVAALRHSPFLARSVRRTLRAYNRPGFHPDDIDSTELLERWSRELFGPDGSLARHLK